MASAGASTGLNWPRSRAVVAKTQLRSATAASTLSKSFACFEKMDSAGRGSIGALLQCAGARPALARIDETQIAEAEIRHGAGAHADVHGELRPHENDGGAAFEAWLGMIRAGAGHRPSIG